MSSHRLFLFQWFLQLLLISTSVSISPPHKIPRLSPIGTILREPPADTISKTISDDWETFFYDQTLDHFNYNPESDASKFKQRYIINSKYWSGPNSNAPIFAYLGAEAALDGDLSVIGFLEENAPHFKALTVYIEHRYYGESNPVGSMEKALKNISARSYFSSSQAIADYAEVLVYLKKKLSAQNSPVIVIGGSYGGSNACFMVSAKDPHIALGALASSAPILYFDNLTPQDGYYSVVTKDFKEVSESCYKTIRESWAEIASVASKPSGLSILSKRFKTCTPLTNSSELIDYLDTVYSGAAQYDAPPKYPVTIVCGGIDGAPKGSDILDKIFAGVVSYRGNKSCYNTTTTSSETNSGWRWQTCSEMVIPIGVTNKDSLYPLSPFILSEFINNCKRTFGVTPRPHWVTTYYGGHDIKLVLSKFASNIIFSNGLRDPYSSGGVLEDISDSVLAVHTVNGSHCLDILVAQEDDPQWLIKQRKLEINIIEGWIKKYYDDLRSSRPKTS